MNRRQWLLLASAFMLSLILAYFLSDLIQAFIVTPVAYFLWALYILYHMVPQPFYWGVLIFVLLFIYISTIYKKLPDISSQTNNKHSSEGPIQNLVRMLEKRQGGVYFKWYLAHTLANVATFILDYQERRTSGYKLEGRDFRPPQNVRDYLEAGVNSTFADYPMRGGLFAQVPKTPYDTEIESVVAFLETELENEHDNPA